MIEYISHVYMNSLYTHISIQSFIYTVSLFVSQGITFSTRGLRF